MNAFDVPGASFQRGGKRLEAVRNRRLFSNAVSGVFATALAVSGACGDEAPTPAANGSVNGSGLSTASASLGPQPTGSLSVGGVQAGRVAPPPFGPLQGTLWAEFGNTTRAYDAATGKITGVLTTAGVETSVFPSPDGATYVMATITGDLGLSSELSVVDTATMNVRFAKRASLDIRELKVSPNAERIAVMWPHPDNSSQGDIILYGFGSLTFESDSPTTLRLPMESRKNWAVDWLPDGRYVRLAKDGQLFVENRALEKEEPLGQRIPLPIGASVVGLWCNRQGTQIAIALEQGESTDLFLAPMSGGAIERLTRTAESYYARWSPDGQQIAFGIKKDANNLGIPNGSCKLVHVPATARDVLPTIAQDPSTAFVSEAESGALRPLPCGLIAWTGAAPGIIPTLPSSNTSVTPTNTAPSAAAPVAGGAAPAQGTPGTATPAPGTAGPTPGTPGTGAPPASAVCVANNPNGCCTSRGVCGSYISAGVCLESPAPANSSATPIPCTP